MNPQHRANRRNKPSCLQSATHTGSMNASAVNSSSSASAYYWSECDTYDDGAGEAGGPSAGLIILMSTYCFEFLVGAPSNLWLVCHILRKRSKVAGVLPVDFFPLHLALTQLYFYLVLPSFFANHYLWRSDFVLAVMTFLNAMVLVMKPLLLCLVCVERYMAVVRPLDYLRFKVHQHRWGCLGLSWCIYVVVASAALVARSSITVCVVFLPVLVTDTFCSLSVLKTLRKPPPGDREMMRKKGEEKGKAHRNAVRMEGGKQEQSRRKEGREEGKVERRGKGEINSMKKKAFITIVVIQAVLILNYLPFIVTLPMDGLVPARTLKCQYVAVSTAAAASCSYLQPLLYLHRLGRLPCTTPQNT